MMPTFAPVQIGELPYVARHLLRVIARHQPSTDERLRRETDSSRELLESLETLILHGLIKPTRRSYRLTAAGLAYVQPAQALPPKALPRTMAGTGTYQGADLLHRSRSTLAR